MGKLVVVNNLTLDGVMQAPGRANKDTRGGFAGGGWATGYADEVMGREMGKGMASTGALLLGRRTYEDFFTFWPKQEGNAISEVLDNTQKFVASHTLTEPLLGTGSRMFDDVDARLELVGSVPTTTGVIIATYRPVR